MGCFNRKSSVASHSLVQPTDFSMCAMRGAFSEHLLGVISLSTFFSWFLIALMLLSDWLKMDSVTLNSRTYIKKFFFFLDLQFHLNLWWDDFLNNKVLYFVLYRPSTFPSALLLKNKIKKPTETRHKKFPEWKQAHVGMEPSKTN